MIYTFEQNDQENYLLCSQEYSQTRPMTHMRKQMKWFLFLSTCFTSKKWTPCKITIATTAYDDLVVFHSETTHGCSEIPGVAQCIEFLHCQGIVLKIYHEWSFFSSDSVLSRWFWQIYLVRHPKVVQNHKHNNNVNIKYMRHSVELWNIQQVSLYLPMKTKVWFCTWDNRYENNSYWSQFSDNSSATAVIIMIS